MSQVKRYRHIVLGLTGGIAEHHSLVAGSLLIFFRPADAPVDVLALLMNGTEDSAGVTVELVFCLGISNLVDSVASHCLQVYIDVTAHFTHDDHLSCGDKCLAGHMSLWVVSQELVKDGVADLVGHFIGMAF